MRKCSTMLSVLALASLGSASQALTSVNVLDDATFFVASNNTQGATNSRLIVQQASFFNPISLDPSESNLGLGVLTTAFFEGVFPANQPQLGTYNFNGTGTEPIVDLDGDASADTTPAFFQVRIEDAANPGNFVVLDITGSLMGSTTVTSLAPPRAQGSPTLMILNSITASSFGGAFVPGVSTPGVFGDGQASINYSFTLDGTPIIFKVREQQSPPLFGSTGTAIEGRIQGVAVIPEPGAVALLVGAGLSGSVFAFRRRRAARN